MFGDDVGVEHGSLLRHMSGFQVREAKFRADMERLRGSAGVCRELLVSDVERERGSILRATFHALNNMYHVQTQRRAASAAAATTNTSTPPQATQPPIMCLSRVKVAFRDEQGEGSGVARSFYTAFADAVLANAPLPSLLSVQGGLSSNSAPHSLARSHSSSSTSSLVYMPFSMHRSRSRHIQLNTSSTSSSSSSSAAAAAAAAANTHTSNANMIRMLTSRVHLHQAHLASTTAAAIAAATAAANANTSNIDNQSSSAAASASDRHYYRRRLSSDLLATADSLVSAAAATEAKTSSETTTTSPHVEDTTPLFWEPNKRMSGFYSPRYGRETRERLNAYRNVGRIVGICLLQNELCPIALSRHVVKYILGRPLAWHDLAFFDADMYESLRRLVDDAERELCAGMERARLTTKLDSAVCVRAALTRAMHAVDERLFRPLDMTFSVDVGADEGGGTHDLIVNGSHVPVTCATMYEYVKRYARFRMCERVDKSLEQLRAGVCDVVPASAFEGLSAEDFRLLLNGVRDVNVKTLAAYTSVTDESKQSVPGRAQFERWFWSLLDEQMSEQERQELLFFWTGSSYLPASEEGFQPLPTITLRPPSDQHLPTANTCINRLYIPMYSSKRILRNKLLMAIKTKTFGFV